MNPESDKNKRFETLLSKALDEKLSSAEREELNDILRKNPEAHQHFHNYTDLHTELEWILNPETLETNSAELASLSAGNPQTNHSNRNLLITWSGWVALAASVILIFIIKYHPPQTTIEEKTFRPYEGKSFVARTNYSSDTIIGSKSTITRYGEWISLGKILLEKGTLGLTFDSGARVVLNAPADFDIEAPNRAFLNSGQVIAQVPEPASGFIINTPDSTLVDLGTEFTVTVDSEQSSVKVSDGEVLAYAENDDGKTEEILLTQNQAIHIDNTAKATFTPANDFSPQVFHDWSRFYEPNANYIHFSFEDGYYPIEHTSRWGEGAKIFKQNLDSKTKNKPKTRIGVFGNALQFRGDNSFLRTSIDGISEDSPRTVSCWIKIPPKQHKTDICIVSWGHAHKGRRWQIGINQRSEYGILGAVRTDFGWGYVTASTDLRDNRWHHITSVYIGGSSPEISAHIRHYVDGKLEAVSGSLNRFGIATETYPDEEYDNITIGYREIKHQKQIGTFEGSIDELYIFDAAILPSQIQQLQTNNTTNMTSIITSK